MIPTRAKDLIAGLASDIGMPEEDLSNILSCYFKENKCMAVTLQESHIVLRGLGILNIQGWKLEEKVKECENPDQAIIYSKALTRWEEEAIEKKKVSARKKQFYDNKLNSNELERKTSTGMEEPGSDS